jgi:hypothetical protein
VFFAYYLAVFENKNSELSRIISNLNLPHPQKKFPSHSPLKKEKNNKNNQIKNENLNNPDFKEIVSLMKDNTKKFAKLCLQCKKIIK